MKKIIILFQLFLSFTLYSQIKMELSNPYIKMGDSTTLTVTIEGNFKKLEHSQPVDITMQSYGQSSSYSLINGAKQNRIIINYKVTPQKAGDIKLPIFYGVQKDGIKVQSEEIILYVDKLEDTDKSQSLPDGDFETEHVKLYLKLPNRDIYVGESVPVEVKAYFLNKYTPEKERDPFIKTGSFTLDLGKDIYSNNPEYVIDGKSYHELIWKGYLTPLRSGESDIKLQMNSSIQIPEGSSGFFTTYKSERIETTSINQRVDIKKLPSEGRPANFSGAIGTFNLNSNLTPLKAKVGDPLTLIIDVYGNGNFDRINMPQIVEDSERWKLYPETSEFKGSNGSSYFGVKQFQQILTPKSEDIKKLGAFSFNYFDPVEKQYKTLKSSEFELDISKNNNSIYNNDITNEVDNSSFKTSKLKHKTGRVVNDFKSSKKGIIILIGISLTLLLTSLIINILYGFRLKKDGNNKNINREYINKIDTEVDKGNLINALNIYRDLITHKVANKKGVNPLSITSEDLKDNFKMLQILKKSEELKYSKGELSKDEFNSLTLNILEEIK